MGLLYLLTVLDVRDVVCVVVSQMSVCGERLRMRTSYEFKRGTATPIIFIFDLRRNVPYFYDTFWVKKITLVAALNAIPNAPWWSEALVHTIT